MLNKGEERLGEQSVKNAQAVDSAFNCFVLLLNMCEMPTDPSALRRDYGKFEPWNSADLLQASSHLFGLKTKRRSATKKQLRQLPTPCILEGKDGEYLLLVSWKDGKASVQRPKVNENSQLTLEELSKLRGGKVLLFTRASHQEEKPFGFGWFWRELLKHRLAFSQVLFAAVLLQVFAMVTPLFSMLVMDKVFSSSGYSTLNVLFVGLVFMTIFEFLIGLFRKHLLTHATTKVDVILAAKVFRHLVHLPISFFTGRQTGDTVTRIKELDSIRGFITGSGITVLIDFPFAFLLAGLMFLFSPVLTTIVLIGIVICFVVYAITSPFLKDRLHEKYKLNTDNQSYLVESVHGINTLKALALEPQMQRRWENQVAQHSQFAYFTERLSSNIGQIGSIVNKGTIAVVMWYAATAVLNGDITPGQMIAINMLAGRVMAPSIRIAQIIQQLHQVKISVKRLREIFDISKEAGVMQSHRQQPEIRGDVKLEHLSFRYSAEGSMVLEDLNLDVKAGEIIGIVGPSGTGKTTLLNLLLRLYSPSQGKVLLDGIDLSQLDPTWIRRSVGVVLQDNLLFNLSVKENIAIADRSLGLEQIEAAAKLAGADEFIRALPNAYDTVVGEKGGLLSAGQRQRIAIARALVMNPKLLLWDEATSALDTESEQFIQERMREICRGKTVFLVAHRFSTLRCADRLVVLKDGRIAEQGSWDELLKLENGLFKRSYQMQSGLLG
jgi:subfamily B ATP-binding cassette protein HlyB/CyaB